MKGKAESRLLRSAFTCTDEPARSFLASRYRHIAKDSRQRRKPTKMTRKEETRTRTHSISNKESSSIPINSRFAPRKHDTHHTTQSRKAAVNPRLCYRPTLAHAIPSRKTRAGRKSYSVPQSMCVQSSVRLHVRLKPRVLSDPYTTSSDCPWVGQRIYLRPKRLLRVLALARSLVGV